MIEAGEKTEAEATHYVGLLPPLLLKAHQIASTVEQGVHGRRRTGTGDSFWQFQSYHWGDDLRHIDWRQSAKSDRLFLRQTEWDAAQSAYIWSDLSPSMHYASQKNGPAKFERALLLSVALCHLLVRGGERVAYFDGIMRPSSGKNAIDRFISQINLALHQKTPQQLPPAAALPTHAQVILLSDFFIPAPELRTYIHRLAEADIHGHLIQITDPAEETMPYQGRIRFLGMEEEGQVLFPRTENIRNEYLYKFQHHREQLKEIVRHVGWGISFHRTDQPVAPALLHVHQALSVAFDRRSLRQRA